jgi:hypothetical protein
MTVGAKETQSSKATSEVGAVNSNSGSSDLPRPKKLDLKQKKGLTRAWPCSLWMWAGVLPARGMTTGGFLLVLGLTPEHQSVNQQTPDIHSLGPAAWFSLVLSCRKVS